jgi:uncharacterized protein YegL
MRRLPVYLLLDCSESMVGDGLKAVRQGVNAMLTALRSNPHALETAYVSIITFGADAKLVSPLTSIIDIEEPLIKLSSGTAFGKALKLLGEQMQSELKSNTPLQKGDFRPLVILITDGYPTDDWEKYKREYDKDNSKLVANFYAVACGDCIDYKFLGRLTDIVLKAPDLEPEKMGKLFVWITATINSASVGAMESEEGNNQALETLPSEVTRIDLNKNQSISQVRRQLLLPGKCSQHKTNYLMRYVSDTDGRNYEAVKSHTLSEQDFEGSGSRGDNVSSENLLGVPNCPYCESNMAIHCECGSVSCGGINFDAEKPHTCPDCNQSFYIGFDGGFDVSTNLG